MAPPLLVAFPGTKVKAERCGSCGNEEDILCGNRETQSIWKQGRRYVTDLTGYAIQVCSYVLIYASSLLVCITTN